VNQARADVAEQEKLGLTRVAQAEQEKEVEVANAAKRKEIGVERNLDHASNHCHQRGR
jgi:hypothetical protein